MNTWGGLSRGARGWVAGAGAVLVLIVSVTALVVQSDSEPNLPPDSSLAEVSPTIHAPAVEHDPQTASNGAISGATGVQTERLDSPSQVVEPKPDDPGYAGQDSGYVEGLRSIERYAYRYRATPSLEYRVYHADVVVYAQPIGEYAGGFRFRAIEYLKGSGSEEFFVRQEIEARNTLWDDRPAILILSEPEDIKQSNMEALAAGTAGEFYFWRSGREYSGDLEFGYSIDRSNPVWLPAPRDDESTFIVELESPSGEMEPIITLAELRDMIAWQETRVDEQAAYNHCVRSSLNTIQYRRDWESAAGALPISERHRQTMSGRPAGTQIYHGLSFSLNSFPTTYEMLWLSGDESDLFRVEVLDDDDRPENGFSLYVVTKRPLPHGSYTFAEYWRQVYELPCGFVRDDPTRLNEVWVTAPNGTLFESFFDPVELRDGGVGADQSAGVVDPVSFKIGSDSSSIESLVWRDGVVVLSLSDDAVLSDLRLYFIGVDGDIGLTLDFVDATVDHMALTWTWPVARQPWLHGDLLMLLIRDPDIPEGGPTPVPIP